MYINGKKAVRGQEVITFRGEKAILLGWTEPYKPSSSGRVELEEIETGYIGSYFPGVIGGNFSEIMKEIAKTKRQDGRTLHIIDRGTTYNPFVVCWNFNGKEWDWGTYCSDIKQAECIYRKKQVEYGFEADLVSYCMGDGVNA